MEQGLKLSNAQHIFLISSDLIACKRVLDQIQSEITYETSDMRPHIEPNHHILVTPFVPTVLNSIIEEEGDYFIVKLYVGNCLYFVEIRIQIFI